MGGREGEKHPCELSLVRPLLGTWPVTQACASTGNRTSDPWVCRLTLNPLSHTSQGLPFLRKSYKWNRAHNVVLLTCLP